jgi:DNA topoisomerase-1
LRVQPEQITINIGKEAKVPEPPAGHRWGGILHDNTVAWLATWTENVNNNIKYVMFAANSSFKGMSDLKKFEKARELKKHIGRIRAEYMLELKDKLMATRQRATTMWLIDKLALRAGNEKGEDEADTVGCCSLRYEHIQLEEDEAIIDDPDNPGEEKLITKKMVVFDFLGKDSIRYYNRVEVDPVVWKNLKIFKKEPKKDGDPIFDRLNTGMLNKHLTSLMPGLTAKVFRTYNASYTFQEELKKTPTEGTVADKVLAYNRANRQVAILCNHQRTVSKGHAAQMGRIEEKILALKYQLHVVKLKMIDSDPKLKKKRPELAEYDSDMDDETFERKEKEHQEAELLKLEKKYEKMCAKAAEEGKPKPEKPTLKEDREVPMERLEKQFESLKGKIQQAKLTRTDKDENKTTALGTSKINYIDPRITAAWCKKYEVPVEKMFPKTLREKFRWAMDVDEDWQF